MVRIGVDTMGGDFGPEVVVPAAMNFGRKNAGQDVHVVLYGVKKDIDTAISRLPVQDTKHSIIDCSDAIEADFHPEGRDWLKDRSESSMLKMVSQLKEGDIDGMFSAGNTAAYIMSSLLQIGKISRHARLALASEFPSPKKPLSLALDMGANPDISPEHLIDYAFLAQAYFLARYGKKLPIGTLNIGTEDGKGMEIHRIANQRLRLLGEQGVIDYIGNLEPEALLGGERKAIIGGAYDMNIALKSVKAGANYALAQIPFGMGKVLKSLSTSKSAGALLLGARKPIAKANGNSDVAIVQNALQELLEYVLAERKDGSMIERIAQNYSVLKDAGTQK